MRQSGRMRPDKSADGPPSAFGRLELCVRVPVPERNARRRTKTRRTGWNGRAVRKNPESISRSYYRIEILFFKTDPQICPCLFRFFLSGGISDRKFAGKKEPEFFPAT